jgi:DNA-binding MarR family transcriptional regulator
MAAERLEPAYRLEDQVGFLLRRAYQRASSNLIDRIGPHDLTAPQFATLARLYERGPLSQNLLGRLVAMEPANIRDVVLRLKKRRLVTTRRDPGDGRLIVVGLTASGLSLVEQLLPIEIACTAKTLAKLNANEKRILYDLLGRLADS